MDHIYPTKDYKVYKIKEEVEKLKTSIRESKMPKDFADIATKEGITSEKLKVATLELCGLYEDFGPDNPSNVEPPFETFPEEALQLNTVKALREGNLIFVEPRAKETIKPPEKANEIGLLPPDLKPYENAVITVRFYEPYKYTPSMKNHPRFHQEYLVLDSHFLTDLRDKFYCHCNQGPFFDISDDPLSATDLESNAANPGFFFIHDTFYNDTRNPSNSDYSLTIRNWYKRVDYIREFKTASMENTKFEDLSIRVGYPCVYQHHGACEHIFCITSVDLIDPTQSLHKSDYPFLNASNRKRSTRCDVCALVDAAYLVTNCAIHVKDPMRVCSDCFFGLHYERDGITKTCSFNAYRLFSVRPEKIG